MQAANNKELRNRWQRGYGSGCKIKGPFACIQYSALVEFGSLVRGCECRSASAAVLIHRVGADSAKSFQNVFTMCSLFLWKKWNNQRIGEDVKYLCSPIFILKHVDLNMKNDFEINIHEAASQTIDSL